MAGDGAALSETELVRRRIAEDDPELLSGLDADLAEMRDIAEGDVAPPSGTLGDDFDYGHGGDGEVAVASRLAPARRWRPPAGARRLAACRWANKSKR